MAIVRMQQRRDTALNWSTYNPVLRQGELGFDTNARKFKIGDGETDWNGLDYLLEEEVEAALAAQVAAEAAQAAAESAAESVIPSTDAAMTAIDADPDSDFRVQSDARQSASFAGIGTQAKLDTTLAALTPGTEYVWNLTDGAGTLLDIVSGVA